TEGAKDAVAGSLLGGIPTGAIAGISHYRKALKQGAGYTVLFDADGWTNPSVFSNLFHAGKWLNGKVQLIPKVEGYPKAGLCEYFKAGNTAEDYQKLINSAKKPEALLLEWGKYFGDIPEAKLSQAVRTALRLAAKHLNEIDQDVLISHIKTACDKVSGKTLAKELKKQKAIIEAQFRKQNPNSDQQEEETADPHPEAFYRGICKGMKLDFENCVTAQTFDGWAYRHEFGANDGDWMVADAAFYHWVEDLGYWEHQPDNKINAQVAEAGEKAFKLKHSKEFGWQVVKPYELNSHKESAFKYCRSRLERSEAPTANTHLRAFKNCVVDLRTGARMPHNKAYYLTQLIPYDYEPGKDCPEAFRKFVADSFGEDMLEVIRAFTSMFLDPTAPFGRFPHLIGQSGGGKGTLGRLWNSLFGEDGASSGDFSNIATAEGRHQYLTGKALFSIPDAGGYVCGLRAFYELVDNGGMSGRALFNPVGYFKTWNTRFWIASVDHLQIENAGDGWARRAYPIPVRARTVKPDPDLRLKLENCKADIISWALAMPREERDRILLSPPTNDRIINLSLDSALYGDSTKSFVDLCLRPSVNGSFVPHHLLHSWYVAYCKEHGYTPLGMSKFISHLKTVLPRNFADRTWTPMVNGQRSKVPAHWEYLVPVEGAFVKSDVEMRTEAFRPPTPADNPVWICIKSQCEEGGLMEFEDFWNPPQPPDENGDNNGIDDLTPSDLPPSGTGGTGWYKKSSIAETTQNQGGQGGTGVQGIGLDLEKNTNLVLEELPAEKIVTDALTGVSRGGQSECRVDSCISPQDELDYTTYPNLTCDTVEANRNQANEIKQKLLTAHTKEELTAIKREFSSRFKWVWRNLMSDAEKQKVTEIATTKQLNLLDDTLSAASLLEGTPSEQLMEVLEVVNSPENFATVIAGHAIDVVQDCIFMLDSQPRRRLLESWLELLQSGE
ncbi:MAG TPA: primase-like DNA-binding domain-containing protein, partial [Candidatus Sericytochromatia bacterium]